jgi:hypothetical protein
VYDGGEAGRKVALDDVGAGTDALQLHGKTKELMLIGV